MSLSHGAPALPYCRNCHFTLATPRPVYCGHCGQETDLHPPSVREMFTEYLGHYVAFDGPLWRTLWALVCLPGHLTDAYFRGRRRRYVLPLRVYLSASFVFFVASALLPDPLVQVGKVDADVEQPSRPAARGKPGQAPASAADAATKGADGVRIISRLEDCKADTAQGPQEPGCSPVQRWASGLFDKARSMTGEQWGSRAKALAPYAMLAMQPVFAALLLAMFAGSRRRYAEHFVFSLHSHSLWFLALLVASLLGSEGWAVLAVFGHGVVALRRVYGLTWWGAAARGLLLSVFYFVLLSVVAVALAILIAVTA